MKKLLLTAAAALLTSISAMAQSTPLLLNYAKTRDINESWPKEWEKQNAAVGGVPSITIKKIDNDIFKVEINMGGTWTQVNNVVYDPTETARIRKVNNSTSLTAYRFTESKDYIWTKNTTLAELYSSPSKWKTNADAMIYTWEHSLGSASLYRYQLPPQPAKKYNVHFSATKRVIKGTWADWSDWSTAPQNSYFELGVVTERSVYNLKYYENGKLTKNYNITYNDQKTKSSRAASKVEQVSWYKINGTKDDWIYLLNTSMGNMLSNPDKWSENNAVVAILDYEKTGYQTRLK